ncbi:patatin-like phospholipase family protein [Polynucleobacter antarcticus]|uniref:PNPLA domain-containing protein n=1 Tax=Polynucleobacter antarcticus TaxID=1743162 RepID=A0A6M9PUI9_9BURK|nr:patatin-like phospholipase family protein [Polynucleobacter antarcticus]QKM62425.1 hypothetical protein DCO16_04730 [Polynucleobacter antarcticus]
MGKERGLVLGGGGIVLISWYVGYFHALKEQGLDLSNTNIAVGTSAGSIFASMLMNGNLWRIRDEMDLFNDFPKVLAKLVPETKFNQSQIRAKEIGRNVKDASPASIQELGRAAMAARNTTGEAEYQKTIERMVGISTWPSNNLYTTATDCYTGERIVVSQSSNISTSVACAASSSLAGGAGPTFLKDRLCMDGGMCATSTHCDVAAGVKKVLVFSLANGNVKDEKQFNLRTTGFPDTLLQELKDLRAQGSQVIHITAGLPPGMARIDSVMNPNLISPFMKHGFERGKAEAIKLKQFWG